MLCRRTALAIVAVASLTTSCRLFKPVNPSAKPEPKSEPAATAAPAMQPAVQPTARPARQPAARAQSSGSVNDANIAAIILASNNTDISYARLVPSRAQRADVKEF